MLKLIKLEWKKNNIGKYIRNALILAAVLCLFIFALAFLGIAEDPDGTLDAAEGMNVISAPIELFTSMSFLIFTSVMLSSFIVSAYKNKTMNLMFSYPIKRQKILASQMIAVWLFNLTALMVTKLFIYGFVYIGSQSMESSFVIDFHMGSLSFYIQLLIKSMVIVSMSFIALFVGMTMKSSKATIVVSFILIFLTQANIGDFSLAGNLVFPVILTIASFAFAVLSILHAETKDLL
ncbi:MAG: ABC transporter permease [Lachnospiraceae bacterium]|nr:ABC transporter permease [Lachnospiraceae bacterium]MDE6184285.1 ABC transporter permease [Lachnospiraceae bacterium]